MSYACAREVYVYVCDVWGVRCVFIYIFVLFSSHCLCVYVFAFFYSVSRFFIVYFSFILSFRFCLPLRFLFPLPLCLLSCFPLSFPFRLHLRLPLSLPLRLLFFVVFLFFLPRKKGWYFFFIESGWIYILLKIVNKSCRIWKFISNTHGNNNKRFTLTYRGKQFFFLIIISDMDIMCVCV